MSTEIRLTPAQQRILRALSRARELSNAQVAETAKVSESYASKVLRKLERAKLASSRVNVQDVDDPQSHYRLWKAA